MDENRKIISDFQVLAPEEDTIINNIYVGKVEKVLPSIKCGICTHCARAKSCYLSVK